MQYLKAHSREIIRISFFISLFFAVLVCLSALWINNVFNKEEELGRIVSTSLREESSRDALSSIIVNEMFDERPALRATIGQRLQPVISGMLDSDVASNAIERVVERLRVAMTTDDDTPVTIELTPIKQIVEQLQSVLGRSNEEKQVDTATIPDQIIIVDTTALPNINDYTIVVLWLGPIAFIFFAAGSITWIYRGKNQNLLKRIRIISIVTMLASITALLTGPLTEPIIVTYAKKSEGRTILSNLYDGLLTSFNTQAVVLLVFSVMIIAMTISLPYVTQRATISDTKNNNK